MRIILAGLALSLGLIEPASGQEPTRIEHAGPFTQGASVTIFPEQVGALKRDSIYRYDAQGRDVSATYNLFGTNGRDLVLTVYVYPAFAAASPEARDAACREEFDASRKPILKPGVQALGQGAAPAVASVAQSLAHRASYRYHGPFDGTEREVRSELDLYCYVGGDWLVKYRATWRDGFDARPVIESFIRNGPWPGRPQP